MPSHSWVECSEIFGFIEKELGGREGVIIPAAKCLPYEHKNLSLATRTHIKKLGRHSTREGETGGSLEVARKPVWTK